MSHEIGDVVEYEELIPYVISDVPDCPKPLIIQAIRDSFRDLCRRTQVWDFELPKINIKKDQADYRLVTRVDCTQITAVLEVETSVIDNSNEKRDFRRQRPFIDYNIEKKWVIHFISASQSATLGGLKVTVALRPTRDADDIMEDIFEDWHEEVAAGAKWRLQKMKGKPWSDYTLSKDNRQLYRDGLTRARGEVNRGRMNSNISALPKSRGFIL